MFANQPDMIQAVEPEILPPSYRVSPVDTGTDAVRAFGDTFLNKPGVRDVAFAQEAVKNFELHRHHQHRSAARGHLPAGGGDPAHPQHDPDGDVRPTPRDRGPWLVGATNWFIRVPFMIEGSSRAWLAQSRPSA